MSPINVIICVSILFIYVCRSDAAFDDEASISIAFSINSLSLTVSSWFVS